MARWPRPATTTRPHCLSGRQSSSRAAHATDPNSLIARLSARDDERIGRVGRWQRRSSLAARFCPGDRGGRTVECASGVQGHSDVDVEAAFGNSESALAAALVDPPVKQCHVWQKEVALKK